MERRRDRGREREERRGEPRDFLRTIVTLSRFLETNVAYHATRCCCIRARDPVTREMHPPEFTARDRILRCEHPAIMRGVARIHERLSVITFACRSLRERLMNHAFSEYYCLTMNVSVVPGCSGRLTCGSIEEEGGGDRGRRGTERKARLKVGTLL